MGFFRRDKPANPRMGLPIDIGDLNEDIAAGKRPSIPWDGRYLVTMVETNGQDDHRLVWEEAATYHQVKTFLKEFQRQYGRPENASELPHRRCQRRVDGLDERYADRRADGVPSGGVRVHGRQPTVLR